MNLDKYPVLFSVKDLMDIFGVNKNTIYKEIQAGRFGFMIFQIILMKEGY